MSRTQSIREYWSGNKPPAVLTVVPERTYAQKPPEQMLPEAESVIGDWYASGANLPPAFFPDFGTISMAVSWGGEVVVGRQGNPYIKPAAGTIDEALDLTPQDNPHAELAVEMYHELRRRTGIETLGFKTPDFQGVLNTAAMVCREEQLLIAMHEQPRKLHRFLETVCGHLIATIRKLRERVGRLDGNIWPYVWVPDDVGVCLTEDLMPLLSAEMFKEFGLPYLKRIAEAFGGVFIHCCGQWGHHARNLADSGINILGVELHHPFTTYAEVAEYLPGVVVTPYLSDFAEHQYEGYPEFLLDVIGAAASSNPVWIAVSDAMVSLPQLRDTLSGAGVETGGFTE
ncbi:MAG: uroporphyrinogen decarboxylase family protein [Phycisphaerae bacterium]